MNLTLVAYPHFKKNVNSKTPNYLQQKSKETFYNLVFTSAKRCFSLRNGFSSNS